MRHRELYKALHKSPFEPFQIQLTNGETRLIHHPDFAALTRTSILVGESSGDDAIPDLFDQYDLLHVVGIEPFRGNGRRQTKKGRKPSR